MNSPVAAAAAVALSVLGMMLVIGGVIVAGLFLPGVVLIGISVIGYAAAAVLHMGERAAAERDPTRQTPI
jgi:hypothetical protein